MKKRICCFVVLVITLMTTLTGCEGLNSKLQSFHEELVGNNYEVSFYDDFGTHVMTMHGEKVSLSGNETVTYGRDSEGGITSQKKLSSIITITIDGKRLDQTGSTVIFAEKGLEPISDFNLPDHIESSGGTLALFDRNINKLKNEIGTPKIVVINSELGVPIAVYGGKSVHSEICNNLPKTTKLSIDGKALYIHRADCFWMDSNLL